MTKEHRRSVGPLRLVIVIATCNPPRPSKPSSPTCGPSLLAWLSGLPNRQGLQRWTILNGQGITALGPTNIHAVITTHSNRGGPLRIVTHPYNLGETRAQRAGVRSHDMADHLSFEILSLSQRSHATPRHIHAGSSTHQAVGRTMSKMLVVGWRRLLAW